MQYYKEHIYQTENILYGIFKRDIQDKISYIIDTYTKSIISTDIINNRAIHNDIVYFDINNKEVIGIKERNISKEKIAGILYLDSKTKYGSIKDKTFYLFKPTNNVYPNFYIPYKISNDIYKNKKIYIIIEFKEWNINSKLPHGIVTDLIGIIGDKESEIEHLRNFYNIKNNNMKIPHEKIKNDEYILNNLSHHDYEVFSIDPIGSTDIDDAFHFNILSKIKEIGIHIASPTIFLKDYLNEILERVSTVYTPYKKYNMLPSIYSDNLVSLLENKRRYALSLILKFDENINLINYELKETVVKNIKNYNYDEFDNTMNTKNIENTNMIEFIKFTEIFFNIPKNTINSHILVEKWMIFTNKKIANILINLNPCLKNIILRTHIQSNEEINITYIEDEQLKKHLILKNENSASYELYDNQNKILTHSKMENDYYTHYTSPIRRSIDFFIHFLIINKKDIFEKNDLNHYLEKINLFTKNCRKFDRQSKRLDFIFSIKEQEKNIETYGYIIEITKNKITVYIPEYNLEEKIIIIPKKLESISNIIISYKNISDNQIIVNKINKTNELQLLDLLYKKNLQNYIEEITYTIDNISITRKLYEKLNLKLYVFTTFENIFDKLKIEIVKT
jgi:exoribonuclease R